MIRFTVFGQLPSGKNRKVQRVIRGRALAFKNTAVRAYERNFALQVPQDAKQAIGAPDRPLRTTVRVWYQSRRSDLSPELVYDLLQESGVVVNDRFIREKHEFGEVDAANPRVEIEVEEICQIPACTITTTHSCANERHV